jgi:hypothetical protein
MKQPALKTKSVTEKTTSPCYIDYPVFDGKKPQPFANFFFFYKSQPRAPPGRKPTASPKGRTSFLLTSWNKRNTFFFALQRSTASLGGPGKFYYPKPLTKTGA